MITFHDATRQQWQKAFEKFDDANFMQSWEWGEVQDDVGHEAVRRLIKRNDKLVGLMACTVKHAKRGRFLEVGAGPLIDWDDEDLRRATRDELVKLAREHGCVFVRIRPQIADDPAYYDVMKQLGAVSAQMPLAAEHTTIVDLTQDLDTLLKNMRQQTRYEVRRSQKRGVEVSFDRSLESLGELHKLQADTALRQHFIPPSKRYLESSLERFGDDARIYRASKEGETLNLSMIVFSGKEAAYYEAGSTPAARREPGAYAIIWQAMQDAKAQGLTRFNLWGVAPPNQPHHRFAGVTTFKRGFGGRDVAYLHAHDIIVSPLRYRLNWLVELARKKRRNL
ncbi:hypothetical protein CR983_03925 [Candidatus Saccharibacteria bacterium]|nr:MAG: hypothetical protein CR983_03925 [Candidatus Saccharibacteria bacterium]